MSEYSCDALFKQMSYVRRHVQSDSEEEEEEKDIDRWDRGFIAENLVSVKNTRKFKKKLWQSMNANLLDLIEEKSNKKTAKKLAPELDMSNNSHMKRLYKAKERKAHFKENAAIITWAMRGGTNFALGGGWARGLRQSGFGYTAHIRGLRYVYKDLYPSVLKRIDAILGGKHYVNTLGHIIVKPAGGTSKLKQHQDTFSPEDTIANALKYTTTQEWVDSLGVQTLLHISGGRHSGFTTSFGPMTPTRAGLLALLIKYKHEDLVKMDGKKLFAEMSGPSFQPWDNIINQSIANRILKRLSAGKYPLETVDMNWFQQLSFEEYEMIFERLQNDDLGPLSVQPMVPVDNEKDTPYLCMWPTGFIHGADPCKRQSRITVTMTFSKKPNKIRRERACRRLGAFVRGDIDYIESDNTQFELGATHKDPSREILMATTFFKDMYVKKMSDFENIFGC
jgi:hypothetical protein